MRSPSPVRYCRCGTRLASHNTDAVCAPCFRQTRSGVAVAPEVPTDFWSNERLRDALDAWHIGRVIRAYRYHPWHGRHPLSQEAVAGWLCLTQTQLSRIETGPAVRDLDKLVRWARALGVPGDLLWFKLPDEQHVAPPGDTTSASPASAEHPAPLPQRRGPGTGDVAGEVEDVRRDEFLAVTGAAVTAMLAPPLVHPWSDSGSRGVSEPSESLLAQIRVQNEGFRWLDRQEGARRHLPATTRHARNLADMWRLTDPHHRLRAPLAEATANACHLVAYQVFDQGQRTQAIEWYRCSAELATRAANQDLYVFAVCGVAYVHARNSKPELALAVLAQLAGLPLSSAARCYTAVYQAHAHASAHRLDLALRALDAAQAHAARTKHEPPSSWLGIGDGLFVMRQRAIVLAQFGRRDALGLLAELDQNTPAVFRRYQVALATDMALTHAHTGEVDQSAELLTTAIDLNLRTRSIEKASRIKTARAVLEPYRGTRAVKTLDEAFRAAGAGRRGVG